MGFCFLDSRHEISSPLLNTSDNYEKDQVLPLHVRKGTEEYVWDHYEESVPMSTYLVAMAISKFEYELAEPADNNVTFRIWARKSSLDQLSNAANVGPKMLQFFEKYFNVTFPLPKQVHMDFDNN